MYLEIQTNTSKNPVGILRSSYREGGKVKHMQHGRITGKTLEELKILQTAFRGEVQKASTCQDFRIIRSKEYGASSAILEVMKDIQLDKIIYSRKEAWVAGALAMIAGRIIYAGSKLSLCSQAENTALFELAGIDGKPDVERDCYLALDKLLERQEHIQKVLAKRHLTDGSVVLYDITSSYFEGEYAESELAAYGYNRDKKNGKKQVVIGLICGKDGCPVAIEIFPGNTKDESTVLDKVAEIKRKYRVRNVIFVGDRGMLTKANMEKLSDEDNLRTITALTHASMRELLDKKIVQLGLFDEKNIVSIIDPENEKKRYCLCKNPYKAEESHNTRDALLQKVSEGLKNIALYKQKTTAEILGSRIGKLLEKYKIAKLINWHIQQDPANNKSKEHKLIWSINEAKLLEEQALDGCYVIQTDVPKEEMSEEEIVRSYKSLSLVEQAFRSMKTAQLEMRPIFHKNDDRIKAHVFLCMLSYHVLWHMKQRLEPLFNANGKGKNREWTVDSIISALRNITRNRISIADAEFERNSEPTAAQKTILDLLGITL